MLVSFKYGEKGILFQRRIMSKVYIGIDNGISGSVGILHQDGTLLAFQSMPIFSQTSYLKTKVRNWTRININELWDLLHHYQEMPYEASNPYTYKCLIERPMINPTRFQASMSARGALEATLIVLEGLSIGYEYCDSKVWQKMLLPQGCKGDQLKIASRDVGVRMWPEVQGRHIDCDGLLIAEWARRSNL